MWEQTRDQRALYISGPLRQPWSTQPGPFFTSSPIWQTPCRLPASLFLPDPLVLDGPKTQPHRNQLPHRVFWW